MKISRLIMLFALCLWCSFEISNSFKLSKFFAFDLKDTTNPQYNVNLAPFIQHLSAYYCLMNVSSDCPGNFTLHVGGWLNISQSETQAFCEGGCAQHTRQVLKCVQYIKDDYKFENKATIKHLNDTINIGCSQGFNGTSLTSGSVMVTTSVVTTFSALAFLALFY
ncbi:hypothetical protein L1887_22976 [Cichorium endivia]|nr:hypothetical protein L1887_22976 [Cichorium endivia]